HPIGTRPLRRKSALSQLLQRTRLGELYDGQHHLLAPPEARTLRKRAGGWPHVRGRPLECRAGRHDACRRKAALPERCHDRRARRNPERRRRSLAVALRYGGRCGRVERADRPHWAGSQPERCVLITPRSRHAVACGAAITWALSVVGPNAGAVEAIGVDAPVTSPPATGGTEQAVVGRYWELGRPRPFLAATVDAGLIYLRPRFTAGYGRPHWSWIGVEADPNVGVGGLGYYSGFVAALPW